MLLTSPSYTVKMVLFAIIIFLNASFASADESIPEPFSEYAWLVDGIRSVASREVEFAPVTTCYDLNEKFAGGSTTSIQKKKEWDDYKGKYIPLTGILEEVKEIPLSNDYLAYFKCINSDSFFVDFTMRVPGELEEYAFSLSPGEKNNVVVRLDRYGETMGVSTELDIIEVDTGNGTTCPAKLSSISRKDDSYRYECKDPNVVFERLWTKNDNPYFEGRLKKEDVDIGIIIPVPGERDYALGDMRNDFLYYGGYGDECYFSKQEIDETVGKEKYEKLLSEAAAEAVSKMNDMGINPGPENHLETNNVISNLDNEKYHCEFKQALRYLLIVYGNYN